MKIRAVIRGQAVHNVGYRIFLLNMALLKGLEGFSATNSNPSETIQQITVLVEGDEEAITEFSSSIKTEFPPHSKVDSVTVEQYDRRVMKILDYMHLAQVEQLDKGIPAILKIQSIQEEMLDKQNQMLGKQDQMLDKQDQMLGKQDQMLGKQDRTIEEISALRSDLRNDMNERFNKIEQELQAMKDALHRSGIMA